MTVASLRVEDRINLRLGLSGLHARATEGITNTTTCDKYVVEYIASGSY